MNDHNSEGAGIAVTARDRVRTGPIPGWVTAGSFEPAFKSDREVPVTYLLFDTQIHAESRETFIHNAFRLETMDAVQHQSQWRLQFEPKTQAIILHSLKVRRGDLEIDQLNLEKAHFLQREEGLDRFVIHGWFTLLVILEDVRPGDILDFSYTIESRPRLLPENIAYFFSLPQGLSVGRYHLSLRFHPSRPMKWKSSVPELKPVENRGDEAVIWEWSGDKYAGPKPEASTPPGHISYPWIQISDFTDWQTIASAIAKTWVTGDDPEPVTAIVNEIREKETDSLARMERLIQLVQDECRYLSVSLDFGGHVPSLPATVARRRFGDCKDLSFLLVSLLRQLGVRARPVLVNTFLRGRVGELLPMPSLFNHVVAEFEVDGKTRWVDATLKDQGGGPFNRFTPNYGLGLPVDEAAAGLVKPPPMPDQSNLYKLHENFLLATSGEPSLLAVNFRAEGFQADALRHQLKKVGLEEMARQRLQTMANRFGNGKRIGTLKFRDDRAANQFFLAEVFEVRPAMAAHPNPKLCKIQMPCQWVAGALAKPEKGPRRTPFALPHPCQITYVFDVDSPSIKKFNLGDASSRLNSQFVEYRRDSKAGRGYFVMNLSLTTNADSVPADLVEEHRRLVEQIWRASSRELYLPKGFSPARQRAGFGELPPVPVAGVPVAVPTPLPAPVNRIEPSSAAPAPEPVRRERRRRRSPQGPAFPIWRLVLRLLFVIFWMILVGILVARHPH